jgi:sec-independent protein translocase protein TatB
MFDIGFSELVVIGVVALVVIGPERLPKTARTVGHLFGRLQRYVNDVKADINREMELDELRKLKSEMQGAAREFEQSVTSAASQVQSGVRNVERELNDAAATPAGSAPATPAADSAHAAQPARKPDTAGLDKLGEAIGEFVAVDDGREPFRKLWVATKLAEKGVLLDRAETLAGEALGAAATATEAERSVRDLPDLDRNDLRNHALFAVPVGPHSR